jgi:hypothetical protein
MPFAGTDHRLPARAEFQGRSDQRDRPTTELAADQTNFPRGRLLGPTRRPKLGKPEERPNGLDLVVKHVAPLLDAVSSLLRLAKKPCP